jgi:hypothetical protein
MLPDLLDVVHPDNRGKATFFLGLGFQIDDWAALADALRDHAKAATVVTRVESPHGVKYIDDGPIETPIGESPRIRSIWISDEGVGVPRLVTAYPLG